MNKLELSLKVAKYGVAVIAEEDSVKQLSVVYSVGFTAINLPEIIMAGLEPLDEKVAAVSAIVNRIKIYPRDMVALFKNNTPFEFEHEGQSYTIKNLPSELGAGVAKQVSEMYKHNQQNYVSMVNNGTELPEAIEVTEEA